jgi:hypothetical protein
LLNKIEQALQLLNRDNGPLAEENSLGEEKPRTYKKRGGNSLYFEANTYLKGITKVDLTQIPGVDSNTALKLIGEIGLDKDRWKSAHHFSSWLGLSPENKISGGKSLAPRPNQHLIVQLSLSG